MSTTTEPTYYRFYSPQALGVRDGAPSMRDNTFANVEQFIEVMDEVEQAIDSDLYKRFEIALGGMISAAETAGSVAQARLIRGAIEGDLMSWPGEEMTDWIRRPQ